MYNLKPVIIENILRAYGDFESISFVMKEAANTIKNHEAFIVVPHHEVIYVIKINNN